MRVKCKWNKNEDIPSRYTFGNNANVSKDWYITDRKEYVVYAVECYESKIWYYVIDDHNLWFPIMKPALLFEIVDSRPSVLWKVARKLGRDWRTKEHSIEILLLAFEEWRTEDSYYELLSDKNPREVAIFAERKKQMDAE